MPYAKGLIVDPPDEKDYQLHSIKPALQVKVKAIHNVDRPPAAVKNDAIKTPVRDQGDLGCCGGESGVAAAESMEVVHLRDPFFPLSPLFLYRLGRINDGSDVTQDTGATLRSIMKGLADTGCCPEALWPYDPTKFAETPPDEAIADANRFRVHSYYRVNDLDEVKLALAARHVVICGIMVYDSFESSQVARTGMVPMPDTLHETFAGGHGIALYDYDDAGWTDSNGGINFKNSWGPTWGVGGYGTLSYDFFDPARNLVSDMWVAVV